MPGIEFSSLRSMTARAACILLLVTLAGCAAISQVPGASVFADAQAMERVSKGLEDDSISDAELREMASRPTPNPPGVSFEIGTIRKMTALLLLGNREEMIELERALVRHRAQPAMQDAAADLLVASNTLEGKSRAALNLCAKAERRWNPNGAATLHEAVDSAIRAVLIANCIDLALDTEPATAERWLRLFPERIDGVKGIPAEAQLTYRRRIASAKILSKTKSDGDFEAGSRRMGELLDDYRRQLAAIGKPSDHLASGEEQLLRWIQTFAIGAGKFARAGDVLDEWEALRARGGGGKANGGVLEQARAEYYSAIGDFGKALEYLDRRWAAARRFERASGYSSAIHAVTRARFQLSGGNYKQAAQTLSPPSFAYRLEGSVVTDMRVVILTLAKALGGSPNLDLAELEAVLRNNPRAADRFQSQWILAAKVIGYERLGRTRGSGDFRKAVEAGREFTAVLRQSRTLSLSRLYLLPENLLRETREAYLLAVIQALGGKGATTDDLLDALSLFQESEIEADIWAATLRRTSIPGVSAAELRRLQDLQQAARRAHEAFSGLAQASDAGTKQLKDLQLRSVAADAEVAAHLEMLRKGSPGFQQAISTRAPGTREVRDRLATDEALVVVAPTSRGTVVAIATRSGVEHRLVALTAAQAGELTARIRRGVSVPSGDAVSLRAFDVAASRQLFESLFSWAYKTLAPVKSITVVAGGDLASIPFALLVRGKGGEEGDRHDYRRTPWLIRSVAITHAPSIASWLAMTGGAPVRPGSYMAWADPDYAGAGEATAAVSAKTGARTVRSAALDANAVPSRRGAGSRELLDIGKQLHALPETRVEARRIAKALGASETRDVMVGPRATRSSVLSASESGELVKRSVVLFATHGLVPHDFPGLNQPALALASEPSASEPPLLMLEDVLGLRLAADWVILSACNTASAGKPGGDALSGLARGFFFAGAQSVLVTHWLVDSDSAAEITTRTMENFVRDRGISRATALQKAVVELIEGGGKGKTSISPEWSHPFFWAPFAVVGNGRR